MRRRVLSRNKPLSGCRGLAPKSRPVPGRKPRLDRSACRQPSSPTMHHQPHRFMCASLRHAHSPLLGWMLHRLTPQAASSAAATMVGLARQHDDHHVGDRRPEAVEPRVATDTRSPDSHQVALGRARHPGPRPPRHKSPRPTLTTVQACCPWSGAPQRGALGAARIHDRMGAPSES